MKISREIPVTESIIEKMKSLTTGFHSIIDIRPTDNIDLYNIDYVAITYWQNESPEFRYNTQSNVNLRLEVRDMKIEFLLNSEPEPDFDVESIIYTPGQRDRLRQLRKEANLVTASPTVHGWAAVKKVQMQYSENFEIGQKVFYQGQKGVISFKHEHKDGVSQRWSVKVKDTEFRRVYGHDLLPRVQSDLSHIKIDKELDKLSTEKLLKMYRRKMKVNKGRGDIRIKRILQDREHIQKGETKIKEVR
jgi:hypothetical protein